MKKQMFVYAGNPDRPMPWRFIPDTAEERAVALADGCTAFGTMVFDYEPQKEKPEPCRAGSLWIDIDCKEAPHQAIQAARHMTTLLQYRYGVHPDTLRYFLSGGKGVHMEIPAVVFGGEMGHPYLPQIHKCMLQWLLDIRPSQMDKSFIDTSLYCMGKGKLLRAENIQRPNGRYKVPLTAIEIMTGDLTELMALTQSPRNIQCAMPELATTRMEFLYDAARSLVNMRLASQQSQAAVNSIMNCAFVQHCYANQATLSEPEWWFLVGILMRCGEAARPIIHEFSLGHPDYSAQKTDEKIASAVKNDRHFSCAAIKKLFPCERECKVRGPGDLLAHDRANHTLAAMSFAVKDDGVYYTRSGDIDADGVRICSPMKVLGKVRDTQGCGWARVVELKAPDGTLKQLNVPMRDCMGRGDTVLSLLADNGLELASNPKISSILLNYIQYGAPEDSLLLQLDKIGWHEDTYVLPDIQFGEALTEKILFAGAKDNLLRCTGTLEEWQREIGCFCKGNSLLVLATSYALTGTLLRLCDMEGGGLHIYGASSTGKTTCALVAGSVCGGGGNRGFLRQWRSTHNALESTAALHNDNLLVLDEVGQASADVVAQVAYMLPNGQGRERLRSDASRRPALTWRLNLLSTGELTIDDKIQETGKLRAMVGQAIRILDLPVDGGKDTSLVADMHGEQDAATFTQRLAQASSQQYGTPLRAFLDHLCRDLPDNRQRILGALDRFVKDNVPTDASGQVRRVARKFALMAIAGTLATEWRILPFADGEAEAAAKEWLGIWLEQRGGHGDVEMARVLKRLQDHFLMESSRYITIGTGDMTSAYRMAGYWWQKNSTRHFFMLPPIFDELTRGTNRKVLMRELLRRGWLVLNANGKPIETKSIAGRNVRGLVFIPEVWEGRAATPPALALPPVGSIEGEEF